MTARLLQPGAVWVAANEGYEEANALACLRGHRPFVPTRLSASRNQKHPGALIDVITQAVGTVFPKATVYGHRLLRGRYPELAP
jgi:hypothetical protein